ncbi:type II toxin-antitoxin system RelE/ParE family toxin [Mycolicibacterium sphagni]|uniref:Type II toxin-antitoxin system RelE/ParE family toxin n=1 Tax=Mycolicibacterium sphagni TaxID=1786 RepID=A0ABX2JWU4_9MYCO|nr:type II toxin-antitoxin system RelE/ParE family toxin [Mycolicibacterium sphagni]NTY62126.1 type II toxin-antitoxin system RelE/ParE family toxin [Mycolicibacterium sphagni]
MKSVGFVGRSRDDLKSFPKPIMQLAGYQLFLMQMGETPTGSKPMPRVGKGCVELVLNGDGVWFRILVAPTVDSDTIWVLHCFQKKTNTTPANDIRLGQARFRQIG